MNSHKFQTFIKKIIISEINEPGNRGDRGDDIEAGLKVNSGYASGPGRTPIGDVVTTGRTFIRRNRTFIEIEWDYKLPAGQTVMRKSVKGNVISHMPSNMGRATRLIPSDVIDFD